VQDRDRDRNGLPGRPTDFADTLYEIDYFDMLREGREWRIVGMGTGERGWGLY